MAGSVNKVILIGNLGQAPEIRSMNNGNKVCNLSIATSESWRDKQSGERRDKTEWHRVVVFGEGLIRVCENYLKQGSKVYIEGSLQTRSWQDRDGNKKSTTEIVIQGFGGTLTMLDGKQDGQSGKSNRSNTDYDRPRERSQQKGPGADFEQSDSDIPF